MDFLPDKGPPGEVPDAFVKPERVSEIEVGDKSYFLAAGRSCASEKDGKRKGAEACNYLKS